jgi:hypothetical protein
LPGLSAELKTSDHILLTGSGQIIFKLFKKVINLCIMNEREFKEFDRILRQQQEEVKRSKTAARKLLKQLGILHLLVPKGTNQASSATSR